MAEFTQFKQEPGFKEVIPREKEEKIADLEGRIQKLTESINAFQNHQETGEPEVRFDDKPTASEILIQQKEKLIQELNKLQSPDQD